VKAPVTSLPNSFAYEHCDIPPGVALSEWRETHPRPNRRAQAIVGLVGAAAALGPIALTLRGIRSNTHH
jgi:hypothetical protein